MGTPGPPLATPMSISIRNGTFFHFLMLMLMLWILECEPRIPISKAYCHILGIKAKRSPAPNVSGWSYLKDGDSVNEARVTSFNISVNDLVYVALSSDNLNLNLKSLRISPGSQYHMVEVLNHPLYAVWLETFIVAWVHFSASAIRPSLHLAIRLSSVN